MKVELQCGDIITIPEGCKAIIKDRSVVFEKEEKQQLFAKMKEQGLHWNAEEKRVEKIRWRAED